MYIGFIQNWSFPSEEYQTSEQIVFHINSYQLKSNQFVSSLFHSFTFSIQLEAFVLDQCTIQKAQSPSCLVAKVQWKRCKGIKSLIVCISQFSHIAHKSPSLGNYENKNASENYVQFWMKKVTSKARSTKLYLALGEVAIMRSWFSSKMWHLGKLN